jgi:hypothetical protein
MELVFRQGDLIAPRDADYPDGALVVHGSDAGGNLLVHPLGGGFEMRLSAGDLAAFERVSDEEQVPVFTSGTFSIDGMEGEFEGWSDGTFWNGWEKPCFARKTAELVLQAAGASWTYDAKSDAFVVATEDGEDDETFAAETVQLGDGGAVIAYFIGAGSWIWEKTE